MSLNEKQFRFTFLVSELIRFAYDNGYTLTFGSPLAKHIKNSFHYKGLAKDFNLFKDGVYLTRTEDHKLLGEYWESLDPKCSWGGRWEDGNHYSYGENSGKQYSGSENNAIGKRD